MRKYSTPWPIIEVVIEPKSKEDDEKLALALVALQKEDSDFRAAIDSISGKIILGGVSEQHLEANVARLIDACKAPLYVEAPQVAYRETLTRRVEMNYIHKKLTGGSGQFAKVTMIFEPADPGAGSSFESKIAGGAVPSVYIPGVEKGVDSAMDSGGVAGFPVVDVKTTLVDGAYHDVDSSALAFEIAAREAFHEALRKGGSVLLEPIMQVEVTSPEEYAEVVVDDLKARHGEIQRQTTPGSVDVIVAIAPLSALFGYAKQLQALTKGRANFAMKFVGYQPVHPNDGGSPPPAAAAALRA